MSQAEALFRQDWAALQEQAWATRRLHHADAVVFAAPGLKRYATEDFQNSPQRFASVSLTGERCELQCEHCQGRLLQGMLPATDAAALLALGESLGRQGCQGLLLSGGCDGNGAVPLGPYMDAIGRLKLMGLSITVHSGLLDRATAQGLKAAGVDQVLFDVVGDAETIRSILHLERSPADYAEALDVLRQAGIPTVPHVVIGLHHGELRGELQALEMAGAAGPAALVLVALRPLPGTPMADCRPVAPEEVGRLAAVARILNPTVPLALGCARPAGAGKVELERRALLAGVNGMAFPDPATVKLAGELGLRSSFAEVCCSLAVAPPAARALRRW